MTPTHRSHARRAGILAVLATAAALAVPPAAGAATAAIQGTTLTVTGDDTAETITIGAEAGKLTLDGSADLGRGAQLPADGTIDVIVDGAAGDDAITVGLLAGQAHSVDVDGGAGNDVITGSRGADVLRGGDGNDRLIGGPNPAPDKDKLSGGAGNDVLVWNPGDDSDIMDGDAGADVAEINGAKGAENF